MEKFITATGKTIDLAIAAALQELNMDRDSVSVEVLDNPKSGFLGIGAQPARVKVTYEVPDEAPKPALSSASRSKPKKPETKPQEQPAAKVIAPAAPAAPRPQEILQNAQPKNDRPEKPERADRPERAPRQENRKNDRQGRRQNKSERPAAAPAPQKEYATAAPGSVEERIETFIKGLLEHMGSDAVPHAVRTGDDAYTADLTGDNLGILIGRRGETLDAIQHLANYAVNRGQNRRVRISVDAENYRLKREQTLQRLAAKMAVKVVRQRRSVTLEPMNAYERHVIHAALQDHPQVTTHSTGAEPNRRVVVSLVRGGTGASSFDEEPED